MSSIVTVGTRPVHGAYVAPAPTRMDLDSVLAPVAETLGVDAAELRTRVREGAGLDDIATRQGVDRDQMMAAIKEGLMAATPAGRAGQVNFNAIAEGLASGTRPADRVDVPPPPPAPGVRGAGEDGLEESLSRVAQLLGAGAGEVMQKLEEGSLTELAASKQVDPQELLETFGRQVDGYI
jgi:uncharacterized protein YidB (DUF937 family)